MVHNKRWLCWLRIWIIWSMTVLLWIIPLFALVKFKRLMSKPQSREFQTCSCYSLKFLLECLSWNRVIIIFEWEVLQKDAAPVSSSAAAPVNIKPAPQLATASNVSAPPYGSYGAPAAPSYGNATVAYGVSPSVPSYGSIPASNPYGQPAVAPYQHQIPSAPVVDAYANYHTASRGGPVVKDNTVGKTIVPISALNPYSSKYVLLSYFPFLFSIFGSIICFFLPHLFSLSFI